MPRLKRATKKRANDTPARAVPPGFRRYHYLSYDEIKTTLMGWDTKYPDLVEVWDAQSRYGVATAGSCGSEDCKQYVLRITNETSMPDVDRPEVFFSGALHGNEQLGPTVVMEFARLLLENYDKNPWITRSIHPPPPTTLNHPPFFPAYSLPLP